MHTNNLVNQDNKNVGNIGVVSQKSNILVWCNLLLLHWSYVLTDSNVGKHTYTYLINKNQLQRPSLK